MTSTSKRKGYQDINALVAFSGTVEDPDLPDSSYTEASMNGFSVKELPHRFATPDYQLKAACGASCACIAF